MSVVRCGEVQGVPEATEMRQAGKEKANGAEAIERHSVFSPDTENVLADNV
jgi:hypothetical protein